MRVPVYMRCRVSSQVLFFSDLALPHHNYAVNVRQACPSRNEKVVIHPDLPFCYWEIEMRMWCSDVHGAFFSHSLTVSLQLGCFWNNWEAVFLCVSFKLFISSSTPTIMMTLLMNYAAAFDLRQKKKIKGLWLKQYSHPETYSFLCASQNFPLKLFGKTDLNTSVKAYVILLLEEYMIY